MKVEIDIEIPDGYELVRYGAILADNYYLNEHKEVKKREMGQEMIYGIVVEKKVKQGEDLVGCLCGLSDLGIENAKENAEELNILGEIVYVCDNGEYFTRCDMCWKYAYPVPRERLLELANIIGE